MKPSWDDAPEWANYLAMDEDGSWYWYELEPETATSCEVFISKGRHKFAIFTEPKWYESLERRPSN